MDSASEDLYFQRIQELVQDDDKIVTVSSLASDLHISLQNSRQLISKYVEDQRTLNPVELGVTYVLSGPLKENGKKGVFMVQENEVEEKRKLFKHDPLKMIYSIQKSNNVDFNVIALVDMFNSNNIREAALEGSIVSKNCVKRELKLKKLPPPPPPTNKGKSSFFTPKTEATTSSSKVPDVSPENEKKEKIPSGIADMFKAAAIKPKNENSSTAKVIQPTGKSGALAGFLSNGSAKSKNHSNTKQLENNSKTQNASQSQNIISEEEVVEAMDIDIVEVASEERKSAGRDATENHKPIKQVREKTKSSKRQRDKSKELPSKKRKRIIQRNDSDSDDMFEKGEDIIEPSDEEPEPETPPPVQKPIVPKNKRRKAVTKTYEDEEGFIVTKTEYVYETASEDENVEPEPPKQVKKEVKPTANPKSVEKKKPAKNQATLMNFFKKI